jgi:hypothetical protein
MLTGKNVYLEEMSVNEIKVSNRTSVYEIMNWLKTMLTAFIMLNVSFRKNLFLKRRM